MKQLLQVFMAPSKEETKLIKLLKVNPLWNPMAEGSISIRGAVFTGKVTDMWESQHLYLVSGEALNEGDWHFNRHGINSSKGGPVERTNKNTAANWESNMSYNDGKSFIRDNYFKIIATTDKSLGLPLIPDSFVNAYATAQGRVNEVLVEYLYDGHKDLSNPQANLIIKLREDGTVIISPAKIYSGLEVENLIRLAWATASAYGDNTGSADCEDWMQHNL